MSKVMLSLATAVAFILAGAAHAQDISKVNGGIHIESGQKAGELSTVNGSVRVSDNAAIKSAETVNGSIRLGDGVQAESLSSVNGAISIGAGSRIGKTVESVNGGITLGEGGEVVGAIENVNGALRMEANSIAGSLQTVSGSINVGADARVLGSITVKKPGGSWFGNWGTSNDPKVIIGARAEVTGPLVFERDVELFVHESARVGEISGAEAKRFSGDAP